MVDRRRRPAAVGAAMLVATEHAPTAHRDLVSAWRADIAGEEDDAGALPGSARGAHRIALLMEDDGRLLVHHEEERPLERDDGEGLISGMEHECAHRLPCERGWMASSRENGMTPEGP